MTRPPLIDPNLLAALIDGRLAPDDAARVIREMSTSDDDALSAYADAMAIAAELNEQDRGAIERRADELRAAAARDDQSARSEFQVTAMRAPDRTDAPLHLTSAHVTKRRRWRLYSVPAVALAAALIFMTLRRTESQTGTSIDSLIEAMPSVAMTDSLSWNATRGSAQQMSEETRAVRVGVLVFDLQLAMARHDSIAAVLGQLESTLEGVAGSARVVSLLGEVRGISRDRVSSAQIAALSDRSIRLVDAELAQLGAYIEAVRIASSSTESGFFALAKRDIRSSAYGSSLDDTQRRLIDELSVLVKQEPRNLPAIHAASAKTLGELTR